MQGKIAVAVALMGVSLSWLADRPLSGQHPAEVAAPVERQAPTTSLVLLADFANQFARVPEPPGFRLQAFRSATILATDNDLPMAARAAFQRAIDIWSRQVTSSVPIHVKVSWMPLGQEVLGSAGPACALADFPGAVVAGAWYPAALANSLAGQDLVPTPSTCPTHDMEASFNSEMPWYFGLDGRAPAGTFDFVTAALHQLGHGLGFGGSLRHLGEVESSSPAGLPRIFDRFVEDARGIPLLAFPSPSASLANALTSDGVLWNGRHGITGAGGARPKLHGPPIWRDGSSYSHLDETTYLAGSASALMTPLLGAAESVHDTGAVTRGMLRDLGWVLIEPRRVPTTTTITSNGRGRSHDGQRVTVTFTVHAPSATSGEAPPPTGSVTVTDGVGSCIGTVATGRCELALFGVGPRTLTATYAGDRNFQASTSARKAHEVTGLSAPPFGYVDTPVEGVTGVTGSLPVTGWALDDGGVAQVEVFREPAPPEPPGPLVLLGSAVFIEGNRPDVAAAFPTLPNNARAGWGFVVLTNTLPNQGNGAFTLHVIATDTEGTQALLGTRTFIADNASATLPFGTLDTPGLGATISGPAYVVSGWALTPRPAAIPADGSTFTLLIDDQPVGNLAYGNFRADVAALFPGLANSDGALGFFVLDTTQFADGLHTIATTVRDDLGRVNGLGSRFVWIENDPVPRQFGLTVAKAGNGGGRIIGSGLDCGSSCQASYPEETVVALAALADADSDFAGWSGDADCLDGTVRMTSPRTCIASFTLVSHPLTVATAGTGSGTVSAPGIACGTDCQATFPHASLVSLTALADAGSTFVAWSGDVDCLDGTVTMTSPLACTATFSLGSHTLTVATAGTGSGTVAAPGIACGTNCQATFPHASLVSLTALADAGSTFVAWSGDADCLDGTVTMTSPLACTATFSLESHTLTVATAGTGLGTVSAPGITCGSDCQATFPHASPIGLTAVANAGSRFVAWGGDADCLDGAVVMHGSRACVATFDLVPTSTWPMPGIPGVAPLPPGDGSAFGQEWWVAAGASGAGTAAAPFGTIQEGLDAAQPGDVVTVLPGVYVESLVTTRDGTPGSPITLRARDERGSVVVRNSGRVMTVNHSDWTIIRMVFDGEFGDTERVFRTRENGHRLTLRLSEVRNSGNNCIDLGSHVGITIEYSLVHHCIYPFTGERRDAHGITGGKVSDLTIRFTEIHTFTGDAVQFDPARNENGTSATGWNNITIEGCYFWLAPLSAPTNGFPAGAVIGENAIDTKVDTAFRPVLTVRNTTASGFQPGVPPYLSNMAAFNIKENVDARFDGVQVHSSEIAFRLRGPALVQIQNALVHDVGTAIRYEDGVQDLRVWNLTVGDGVAEAFQPADASPSGIDSRNVLVLAASLPPEAAGPSNLAVSAAAFVSVVANDYRLSATSTAVDRGESLAGVATDIRGEPRPRGLGFDVGAFESP